MTPGRSFLTGQHKFKGADKASQFVCKQLRSQLDDLRGIVCLYISYLDTHKPKRNESTTDKVEPF